MTCHNNIGKLFLCFTYHDEHVVHNSQVFNFLQSPVTANRKSRSHYPLYNALRVCKVDLESLRELMLLRLYFFVKAFSALQARGLSFTEYVSHINIIILCSTDSETVRLPYEVSKWFLIIDLIKKN